MKVMSMCYSCMKQYGVPDLKKAELNLEKCEFCKRSLPSSDVYVQPMDNGLMINKDGQRLLYRGLVDEMERTCDSEICGSDDSGDFG